jgi:beta-glucosidase
MYYYHKPTGRNDDYLDTPAEPLFPFGYGLSYTHFEYRNPRLDKTILHAGDSVILSCTIRNAGKTEGDEVVQLYLNDQYASVARPVLELKGFRRVHLSPGEAKQVTFLISPEMLSIYGLSMKKSMEPGDFQLLLGASSKDLRLKQTVKVIP